MAVSYMGFSAKDVQYKGILKDHVLFKKNDENYIYELGIKQLNSIGNMSFLDFHLSERNVIEAHYHQNASEVIYCITGSALTAMVNPDTNELINVNIGPGEVVSIPQGWWHYLVATEDNSHLWATFDTPMVQTIFGSQILRITPKNALAYMYCLDEETVAAALDPIDETIIIGPPSDCMNEDQNQNESMKEEIKNKDMHMNMDENKKHEKTPPEKAKRTWQPYAPPFPGAFYPKQ